MNNFKVIHFDDSALNSITGISSLLTVLKNEQKINYKPIVVLSSLKETEHQIRQLVDLAKAKKNYKEALQDFFHYPLHIPALLVEEYEIIEQNLKLLYNSSEFQHSLIKETLEISSTISAKIITEYLDSFGTPSKKISITTLLPEAQSSSSLTTKPEVLKSFFKKWNFKNIPIIYSPITTYPEKTVSSLAIASQLTSLLSAKTLDLYSQQHGLYSAPPKWVSNAQQIQTLHYEEAITLSHLGWPLPQSEKIKNFANNNTLVRLLNLIQPELKGTVISNIPPNRKLKSIHLHDNIFSLQLQFEETSSKNYFEEKITILLNHYSLSRNWKINTTPLSIQYLLFEQEANLIINQLEAELQQKEIYLKVTKNIAIISLIGSDFDTHQRAISSLIKNNIKPLQAYQSDNDVASFFVVEQHKAIKGLNLIHHQLFKTNQIINLAILGHGTVGSALLQQILQVKQHLASKRGIHLNVFSVSNSQKVLLKKHGIDENWQEEIDQSTEPQSLEKIIAFAKAHHLENLILVDNTAHIEVTQQYALFVENGFNIVSSNKIANTLDYPFYQNLRRLLKQHQKSYLYETNVGAGLPLIDTIQLLHASGENITKIQGVFSGTLSYLFNEFSKREHSFSELLLQAQAKGFTEPDPREDLSGQDVARKLLILARELDLENEFSEIDIESLVPSTLNQLEYKDFITQLAILDEHYSELLKTLPKNKVLRYVGTLSGDLQQSKGILKTSLIQVDKNSSLGQLSGSDSFFEIYTESYGDLPIIIQGAGAGASVTARGVLGDILRIAQKQ